MLLDPNLLSNLVKEYLTNCLIEDKTIWTIRCYSQRLYDLANFAASSDSLNLTTSFLRGYFKSLIDRGISANTRNGYYRAIHTFLEWMMTEHYLKSNPLTFNPPRLEEKIIRPFSIDDIRKLLLLCSGSRFLDIRNRAMVLMFLDTGLRLEEMSRIQKADIDIINGIIVVHGKGKKERRVRLGKTARKALYKYICQRDDIYPELWLTEERRPMTRGGIKITIKKLCQRAHIPGGPHKLRHTAATSYLRNGGTEFTLQIMLGHSTLAMTRRYSATLSFEDMVKIHEKASPVDNLNLK